MTAKKAAVHHPLLGGDGGLSALPWRLRHLRMALGTNRVFRPLRRVTGALPLAPAIFLKKSSKTFIFYGFTAF